MGVSKNKGKTLPKRMVKIKVQTLFKWMIWIDLGGKNPRFLEIHVYVHLYLYILYMHIINDYPLFIGYVDRWNIMFI